MQGQAGPLHAAGLQGGQQLIAEMQAGGGGGHRARAAGEPGLVALLVGGIVLADVGGQRHLPIALKQGLDRLGAGAVGREAHHPAAAGPIHRHDLERHGGLISPLQLQHLPRVEAPGRTGQTEPVGDCRGEGGLQGGGQAGGLQHQQLHQSAAGPPGLKPGPEHPRVVHHQQIAGAELVLKIPDRKVARRRGLLGGGSRTGSHRQHPGRMPRFHRPLGDGALRQVVAVARQAEIGRVGEAGFGLLRVRGVAGHGLGMGCPEDSRCSGAAPIRVRHPDATLWNSGRQNGGRQAG